LRQQRTGAGRSHHEAQTEDPLHDQDQQPDDDDLHRRRSGDGRISLPLDLREMCTGRLVDCGPVRNSAKLMSENEMMKAKIAPETRLDRNSGNVTMSRDRDAGGGHGR
jgi:hypothetical protein